MTGLFYSLPLSSNWLQAKEGGEESNLKSQLQALHEDKGPLVLLGDENCGKTLLLFQAAVAYASQDFHVTFISRHAFTKMPLPVHGTIRPETAEAEQLKTLTFLYMSKVEDLVQYCSSIHTRPALPDVVIVDDLDFYLGQLTEPSLDSGCAKLCAILLDTKCFIQSKQGLGVLMLGCRSSQTYLKQVFSHFDFAVAMITAQKSEQRQFSLVLKRKKVSVTLTYSIEEIGLYLQNVSLQSEQALGT